MAAFIEFDVIHDDFHIGGQFHICERLLIEFSTNIHREFEIESVRLLVTDDLAVSVPSFISDYVASWAQTADGKVVIQKAYDAALPDDGESYIYEAPRDHRSIWQVA